MANKVVTNITVSNGLVQSGTSLQSTAPGQALIRDGADLVFRALTSADVSGSGGGLTTEDIDDRVAALLVAGANVTLTYNDASNTLTIAAAGGGGGAPSGPAGGDLAGTYPDPQTTGWTGAVP